MLLKVNQVEASRSSLTPATKTQLQRNGINSFEQLIDENFREPTVHQHRLDPNVTALAISKTRQDLPDLAEVHLHAVAPLLQRAHGRAGQAHPRVKAAFVRDHAGGRLRGTPQNGS